MTSSKSPPSRMKITDEILFSLAKTQPHDLRRDFTVPSLPPGVVPAGAKVALDNSIPMLDWLNGNPGFLGMGFPGCTYLAELSQRSEYRAPAETISGETTRTWITLTGAEDEKLKELSKAMDEFKVRALMNGASLLDGFFGRSQVYISIKGQNGDVKRQLPLLIDPKTIPKGSLERFRLIEPVWTTPYMYNAVDPTRDDFYVPESWYVLGKKTHSTRLLTFISHPLPDIVKPAYNFSGISLSQLIEPYVRRWLKTVDSVNQVISNYSVACIKTNMMASLEGNGNDDLSKRAQLLNLMKGNSGVFMLDKDSEDFFQVNTPLSGLSELQAQAQEHMAAPTHIPLVKLTGITPSGLNASSEGELKVWYDYCGAYRMYFYNPHLVTILRILQCHLWGEIDENITFHWEPLDTPTEAQLSKMRFEDAQADEIHSNPENPAVSASEVRIKLSKSPNSGFSGLTGPPPEPKKEPELKPGGFGANKPKK